MHRDTVKRHWKGDIPYVKMFHYSFVLGPTVWELRRPLQEELLRVTHLLKNVGTRHWKEDVKFSADHFPRCAKTRRARNYFVEIRKDSPNNLIYAGSRELLIFHIPNYHDNNCGNCCYLSFTADGNLGRYAPEHDISYDDDYNPR